MTTEYFVKPVVPVAGRSIQLSPIDQLHGPIRQFDVFCFKLSPAHTKDQLRESLNRGLSYTLAKLPDFLSNVVDEEGDLRLKRLEIKDDATVRLLFKDYEDPELQGKWTAGTYEQLEKEDMPSSKLTTPLLAQHAADPDPFALSIQANFIPGGLLLAIIWHHAVCDGNGLNVILQSWSKHVAEITSDVRTNVAYLPTASLDRHPLSHGNTDVTIDKTPGLSWAKDAALPDFPKGIPRFTWAIWNISAERAAKLKEMASAPDSAMSWVSSGDAYTALLWKRYAAARTKSDTSSASKLWFPVDFRKRLDTPLPSTYIGNSVLPCVAPSTTADLATESLYSTALRIRQSVHGLTEKVIRDHIGLINEVPKLSDITFNVNLFGTDLAITNWSGLGYLETEWGSAMGKPQFLRRTGDSAVFGGVAVVQPRDQHGGFNLMTLFEVETTEALKKDELFREYFEFLCY
ncbi:transferase family-domain-containing protein [Delphinella strobiligena]|nr:transferase family-domain-containing protein [Delphinella strobiligena]